RRSGSRHDDRRHRRSPALRRQRSPLSGRGVRARGGAHGGAPPLWRGPAPPIVYIVGLALAAIFRTWVAPYDPNEQDIPNKFATPSWEHWVGTDNLGRDLLSRLIYGAWLSLQVSLFVVAIAMVVSLVVGLFSGYVGGRTDNALMRVVDG